VLHQDERRSRTCAKGRAGAAGGEARGVRVLRQAGWAAGEGAGRCIGRRAPGAVEDCGREPGLRGLRAGRSKMGGRAEDSGAAGGAV